MAKQTFVTGQVLTAAQQNALQANDYNQTVSAKVASYVLVAADAGTRITMSNAGATTITVNTSLFTAGDTLFITNIGAGASTITAGTATVSTASSLVLAQYDSGRLYFTSTGVAIWEKYAGAVASGSSFVGCSLSKSGAQTITTATLTTVTFDTELFDTSAFHDNVTNNSRITIPSGKGGYYLFNILMQFGSSTAGQQRVAQLYKNGSNIQENYITPATYTPSQIIGFVAAGAVGDYFEIKVYHDAGANSVINGAPTTSTFSATYLGA